MSNDDPQMPVDAPGLVKWLENQYKMRDATHVLAGLCDEAHRLDMAFEMGQQVLIENLKTRYKLS